MLIRTGRRQNKPDMAFSIKGFFFILQLQTSSRRGRRKYSLRRKIMPNLISRILAASVTSAVLLTASFIPSAWAERSAGWWDHANSQAQREGYKVITTMELKELYQGNKEFVILDNRFPYELSEGLLPGAKNVSFDLSELQALSEEKKGQLLEAAGPDMDKIIVTYCRDFR